MVANNIAHIRLRPPLALSASKASRAISLLGSCIWCTVPRLFWFPIIPFIIHPTQARNPSLQNVSLCSRTSQLDYGQILFRDGNLFFRLSSAWVWLLIYAQKWLPVLGSNQVHRFQRAGYQPLYQPAFKIKKCSAIGCRQLTFLRIACPARALCLNQNGLELLVNHKRKLDTSSQTAM